MDANEFVRKWAASTLTEKSASQSHFIELCRLLGESTPTEADPTGDFYTFEKHIGRTGGGGGFADVWLKDHFGWEYKGKHRNLQAAYKQLIDYHEALGQPPLLMVCDFERYELHTKWTNTESWLYSWRNNDIAIGETVTVSNAAGAPVKDAPKLTPLQVLKAMFEDPAKLKPGRTTHEITEAAAGQFKRLADQLGKFGDIEQSAIGHLVSQLVFCLFATDVGLLPKQSFSDLLRSMERTPDEFRDALSELFGTMREGGRFGAQRIPHINGWLFADTEVPRLTTDDIRMLQKLDDMNWTEVEPAVFGTLFERLLDPKVRAKLGAHYTSRADIELLVRPVLMQPLEREWAKVQADAMAALGSVELHGATETTKAERVRSLLAPFLERLANIRVLDPACGSGNFLYVSLALLKALEKEVIAFGGLYGAYFEPRVHPRQLRGIEVNPYAQELASVVIWIGYLQWKFRNALPLDNEEPVLEKLEQVRLMDAILDLSDPANPREPEWPEANVVVGNPPFLGTKMMRRELSDEYVETLRALYADRLPGFADLCCYWFEKARAMIEAGTLERAGLLATQGIRGGLNRVVLQRIKETGDIFFAESDRKWILDGAAVHISMVGFDDGSETRRMLDGRPVEGIHANLTWLSDVTTATRLAENSGIGYVGDVKVGKFDLDPNTAELMLKAGGNPNSRPNSDVLRPWANGLDITRRNRGIWIIDFPSSMSVAEAALYERPFQHVEFHVKPLRDTSKRETYRRRWWVHAEPCDAMRAKLAPLTRYVATPTLTKYRLFVWLTNPTLPDHQLIAFARDDDYFFGVLHSRPHELWARATGTQLREAESGFRYTPTTCFETFPFPWPPSQEPQDDPRVAAIAEAAKELDTYRNNWLNPPEDSLSPTDLKKRTLTNLYNERPTWLANAHAKLDEAVFAAYGWPETPSDLSDEEILARLLALNLERAPQ